MVICSSNAKVVGLSDLPMDFFFSKNFEKYFTVINTHQCKGKIQIMLINPDAKVISTKSSVLNNYTKNPT